MISSSGKLPPPVADPVAAAFAHTFWWAVATILLAFIPTLFLPNHAQQGRRPVPRWAGPVAGSGRDVHAASEDVTGAMVD